MPAIADGNFSPCRSGCQRSQLPAAITQQQLAITACSLGVSRDLPRQCLNHALTVLAQAHNRLPQKHIMVIRSPDTGRLFTQLHLPQAYQGFQVGGEACRRTRAAKISADVVITAALGDGITHTWDEGREHYTRVVVITAQLAKIEVQR